jgi:hypothetical protein
MLHSSPTRTEELKQSPPVEPHTGGKRSPMYDGFWHRCHLLRALQPSARCLVLGGSDPCFILRSPTSPAIRLPRVGFWSNWLVLIYGRRGLRRRSAAAWLLGSRVPIPLRAWMFVSCVSMLCCPVKVEVSETGWSLVQRSPTVCLYTIVQKARGNHCIKKILTDIPSISSSWNCCKPILTIENNKREKRLIYDHWVLVPTPSVASKLMTTNRRALFSNRHCYDERAVTRNSCTAVWDFRFPRQRVWIVEASGM